METETHTFHITVGEATVTLQYVNVLWGLPIEGKPVSRVDFSFKLSELIERCELLLGFTPSNTDIVGGRIKLVCLLNQLESEFPENPNSLQCTQRARLVILYLGGGTLFTDSTDSKVMLFGPPFVDPCYSAATSSFGEAPFASHSPDLIR
ncbi:hypothetical protein E3N88_32608 [Mikania micrantha]|uniref:Aminotransferase-like plant mobile domain-containing protein n=1 Tax=Mikania micrantha TaxID=192012 RepID=A0A5N6MBJ4_9ASTR|nr:hypothetical protein E3N88_32608 [Mikania micrantha]